MAFVICWSVVISSSLFLGTSGVMIVDFTRLSPLSQLHPS